MALDGSEYRLRTSYDVSFFDKPFQNVWYFVRTTGTQLAEDLVTGFIQDFVPIIASILPDYIDTIISVAAENLLNLDDIFEDSTALQGDLSSTEATPSFVTASFCIFRSTRQNKRQGRKAFGPLAEDLLNGNSPDAAYAAALAAAKTAFGLNITEGGSVWRVGIPRSVLVANPNAPPAQIYEIQDVFPMANMEFAHISTQNSRKAF